METKIIKTFILNKEEAKMVKACLDYCQHRLAKHQPCGLNKGVNRKEFDKLKTNLEIELNINI